MISPKEQVEVMERIFGEPSYYSKETRKERDTFVFPLEKQTAGAFVLSAALLPEKASSAAFDPYFCKRHIHH